MGSLPNGYRLSELIQLFETFGCVSRVTAIRDFAFLAIYDNDAAAAAINSLHNTQFGNQEIIVERARFPRARFQQNGGRGGLRGRQFNGEQNSGETGEDNYQQQNALGFQQSNQMGGSRGQDEGNDGGYQGDNGGNNGNIGAKTKLISKLGTPKSFSVAHS